jgi:hypothetical protein
VRLATMAAMATRLTPKVRISASRVKGGTRRVGPRRRRHVKHLACRRNREDVTFLTRRL